MDLRHNVSGHTPLSAERSRRTIYVPPGAGRSATFDGDTLPRRSGYLSQLLPEDFVDRRVTQSPSVDSRDPPRKERSPVSKGTRYAFH